MHCGSLFYLFLMKTATKKTNSVINEEIKPLLTKIALLDQCLASLLSLDLPPHLRPIQAKINTFITLFEKCMRIYALKIMKSKFKKAGTLQLTGIHRSDGEL